MGTSRIARQLSLSALLLVVLSCGDGSDTGSTSSGSLSNERMSIVNEEEELISRVQYFEGHEISIDPGQDQAVLRQTNKTVDFRLQLVAQVLPPSVQGQVLQATSVLIKGNHAIVSYNMKGAEYLGGIDVFNITNKQKPRLESQVLFSDSDVNSVSLEGGYVYAAEATNDEAFGFPSVFEVLTLNGNNLILEENRRVPLNSFAATCVVASGERVYATAGDTGGLSVFDTATLAPNSAITLHDARWVDAADGKVVVVQGTPGQISVFDEGTLELTGTFPFAGADVPESKSTVQVVGGKAFVAAGTRGVQILSIHTGASVGTVPLPDPVAFGLNPSVAVTNAVAVDEDLLFISHGEAGVFVARGAEPFADSGSEVPQDIDLLGQLQFDELQSVNHVAYKNDYLIIAAGLGGLKIVQVVF